MVKHKNMKIEDTIITRQYLKQSLSEFVTKEYLNDKLSEFVTKDYLQKTMSDFVTKEYFKKAMSDVVTKEYLKKELSHFVTQEYLKKAMQEQKVEIVREIRIMMHETMESGMENMKLYYQDETQRYMKALLQGFKDEMLVYRDQMTSYWERLDQHDQRITSLEKTAV